MNWTLTLAKGQLRLDDCRRNVQRPLIRVRLKAILANRSILYKHTHIHTHMYMTSLCITICTHDGAA